MKTIPRTVRWLGVALAVLMGAAGVMAQNGGGRAGEAKKKEKLVQFQMAGQAWNKVIQFLVDNGEFQYIQTSVDLPRVDAKDPKSAYKSFTFSGPANRMYTITDIFDILNTALLPENRLLLRRGDTLMLVGSSNEIPVVSVPRITADQLSKYGHTDVVSVVARLKGIQAKDYVGEIKAILGPFGSVTLLAKTNQLIVQDVADNVRAALKVIGEVEGVEKRVVEAVPLNVLDAERASKTIAAGFADVKSGGPFIEADIFHNAIVIKGTAEQVNDVKAFIGALEKTPSGINGSGNVRIFTLERGSAATLGLELKRMLRELRRYDVDLIMPGGGADAPPELKKGAKGNPLRGPVVETEEEQTQLVEPGKDGKLKKDRVRITAFGNKLIVTSDSAEALALAQELFLLYTRTAPGEGDFEVIRLKVANAVEVSIVLDDFFNGPRKNNNNNNEQRRGFGRPGFGPRGGQDKRFGNDDRIRVVADPTTNSLLVRATPLDMLTIRNRLLPSLDSMDSDSVAVIKTHEPIRLKYAGAGSVFDVLREVYRESMNNNPRKGQDATAIFSFNDQRRQPVFNIDANGNPRGVTLSIGVDDKTNSIIVACPESLYKEIKDLVKQLDVPSEQVIEVRQVAGVDPSVLQQAIDAMQGRKTTPTVVPNNSPFGGNPFFRPGGPQGQQQVGGRPPGGQRSGGGRSAPAERGPNFFAQGVMDDPPVLFDPQRDDPELWVDARTGKARVPGALPVQHLILAVNRRLEEVAAGDDRNVAADDVAAGNGKSGALQYISAGDGKKDDKKDNGKKKEPPPGSIVAPRGAIEIVPVPGGYIIRAGSKADLELAERIIKQIIEASQQGQIDIETVPLKHADATSVVTTLSQLFSRVAIGQGYTQVTQGGAPGQQPQQQPAPPPGGQLGGVQATGATPVPQGMVLIPLPRTNSILVAAIRARMKDVMKQIALLDVPHVLAGDPRPFALKRATASKVAATLTQFWADRFPNEQRNQHQVRITSDDNSNTVWVQAAPADMTDIAEMIRYLDTMEPEAKNDMLVIPLRTALADDLAAVLLRAITAGAGVPSPGTTGAALPPLTGPGVTPGGPGQLPGLTGPGAAGATSTRVSSIRFFSSRKDGPEGLVASPLNDVQITPDTRTNSLIVSAPEKTMKLILALVRELDVPPLARSEISIFTLKKVDANLLASQLQQLFLGLGTTGGARPGGGLTGGGLTGGGLTGGGLTGGGLTGGLTGGGLTGGGLTAGALRPLQITISGTTPEGAPIIDLRLTVDDRTNSLIVAGNRNDLDVIEAIISRLEDSGTQQRQYETYRLVNTQAADIANALNDFLTKSLNVEKTSGIFTAFQELQRDVIIVPDPISNTLMISATPQKFVEVMQLIQRLDYLPPQVVIQVLIAEVDLNTNDEFGVELGLQTPVLFQRSVVPFPGGAVSSSFSNTGSPFDLVGPGQSISGTANPGSNLGFLFNNVTQPLGNNVAVNPGLVGYQGLQNLGVGRVSPNSNIGGFVFSAAADTVNVLIRALRQQGRIDILSRPQIMTLDNQFATVFIGQQFPIVSNSSVTGTGIVTTTIDRPQVGVQLDVTPKIFPDGKILMRVTPSISSVIQPPIQVATGVFANAIALQKVDTTLTAQDGETVIVGGLITTRDAKAESKIPMVGDIPWLGAAFRYRTWTRTKSELLVILTPHIVRCRADAERVLADESRRMDWVLGNAMKLHATPDEGPAMSGPPPLLGLPGAFPPPGPMMPPAEPGPQPRPAPGALPDASSQSRLQPHGAQPAQSAQPQASQAQSAQPQASPPVQGTTWPVTPALNPDAANRPAPGNQATIVPAPTGNPPNGNLPNGNLPNGNLPNGNLPNGNLPNGNLPIIPMPARAGAAPSR